MNRDTWAILFWGLLIGGVGAYLLLVAVNLYTTTN